MKKIHFNVKTDGFYGVYWKCKTSVDITIIAMLGNDPEGYMAKSCAKWLKKNGVNVLTMSPAKKNFSHHNYPLERIEKAQKQRKQKNRHRGRLYHRNACADRCVVFS